MVCLVLPSDVDAWSAVWRSHDHVSGRIRIRPGSTAKKWPAQSSRNVIKCASRCPASLRRGTGMNAVAVCPFGFDYERKPL
jgi:hypothetical protein